MGKIEYDYTKKIQYIQCIISFMVFLYIKNNLNSKTIFIYKHPIFKVIFLLLLFVYGDMNQYLTVLCAFYYIYIGQLIQDKELLYKI